MYQRIVGVLFTATTVTQLFWLIFWVFSRIWAHLSCRHRFSNAIQGEELCSLADIGGHCRQTVEGQVLLQPHEPRSEPGRRAVYRWQRGARRRFRVTAISLLAFLIVRRQRAVAIALALYTISNAEPGQLVSSLRRTIGRIGVKLALIAQQQGITLTATRARTRLRRFNRGRIRNIRR